MNVSKIIGHAYTSLPGNGPLCVIVNPSTLVACNGGRGDHVDIACVHCQQPLERDRGDGTEVCRFCYPHQVKRSTPCVSCQEKRWHVA